MSWVVVKSVAYEGELTKSAVSLSLSKTRAQGHTDYVMGSGDSGFDCEAKQPSRITEREEVASSRLRTFRRSSSQ